MVDHALDGVKILAFEQAAAGPFGTHLLADMGADVIKIERPGSGDVVRGWDEAVPDPKGGPALSSGYVWLSRRKRSVTVDTRKEAGRAILRRLAEQVDVFITNTAPGVPDRLGIGWADLHALNPRLVYCSLTGYGSGGPYRDEKAYDLLIQGEAGIIATTGYPDAPAKVGLPISDIAAGMYSALGIVMALFQRERTGEGQFIDVSMFESMLSWLGYFPQHYWHRGTLPERVGMYHHFVVPYGPYMAGDGKLVILAVASAQDWEVFCNVVVEHPEWINDPRFNTIPLRAKNRDDLKRMIEEVFSAHDSDYWLERLKQADLPNGRVRGIDEVLAHPQIEARNLIRQVDSPFGPLPTIETALRLSGSPPAEGPIPSLGGNTDEVLTEAGFTPEEIAQFHADGVV
jgi:itaconate CoA-transferase